MQMLQAGGMNMKSESKYKIVMEWGVCLKMKTPWF